MKGGAVGRRPQETGRFKDEGEEDARERARKGSGGEGDLPLEVVTIVKLLDGGSLAQRSGKSLLGSPTRDGL